MPERNEIAPEASADAYEAKCMEGATVHRDKLRAPPLYHLIWLLAAAAITASALLAPERPLHLLVVLVSADRGVPRP